MICMWCGKRPLIRQNEYVSATCGHTDCQRAAYEAGRPVRARRRKVRR